MVAGNKINNRPLTNTETSEKANKGQNTNKQVQITSEKFSADFDPKCHRESAKLPGIKLLFEIKIYGTRIKTNFNET